ncbi:MAG: helicase-associated domain-containing protein [Alicyclobacillus sp.]|nr:helicase-associated domain-containing protein [Alicyclobacillus sp.]
MNLAECLTHADIATLREIAKTYDLHCSPHSKLALMQEILFCFKRRTFLEEQLPRWREGVETVVLRLSLEARNVFSAEEVDAMFSHLGGDRVARAVREGWLFPSTRASGRLQYVIPKELQEAMRQHAVSVVFSQVRSADDGPYVFRDEAEALSRDADVFLQYVRHHDVQLTADGSMYKRHLTRLLDLLEVPEQPLEPGWRFGYGRRFYDYPDRFALIYDHAYARQLIEEGDDGILRCTDEAAVWLDKPVHEKQRSFVSYYVSAYRRPIPRLPQVVRLLAYAPKGVWMEAESMFEAYGNLINAYYYDTREAVWQQRILKMLRHLGILRVGEDEMNQTWFQTTNLGQQLLTPDNLQPASEDLRETRRVLIVQPNFDVFVTADQPRVTAELAAFADLRQSGVLQTYRLSRDSVARGLASGRSIDEWLTFLHTHAQAPVPGNVERMLKEWGRGELDADHGADASLSG